MITFFRNLKLGSKIPVLVVCAAATLGIGVSLIGYQMASDLATRNIQERLDSVARSQTARIKDYFGSIEKDLHVLATDPAIIDATHAFSDAWQSMNAAGADPTKTLQAAYITENPHPTGQKDELNRAAADNRYNELHGKYHPWLRGLLRKHGYYDVFIFDVAGNLIYTVFKELDYATNLNTGEWRDTDLGNAFRAALNNGRAGSTSFFDFKPYAPSHDAPASFMSTPILDASKTIGVLVYQMPIDGINAVMNVDGALGSNGEAVLVGADKMLRNDSPFSEANDILKTRFEHPSVDEALAGTASSGESDNYRSGVFKIAAEPLELAGTNLSVVALMNSREAYAPVVSMRIMFILVTLIGLAVTAAAAFLFSRTITQPLHLLSDSMTGLASGRTDVELTGADRPDEIGDMTRSVAVFRDNAVERNKLEDQQKGEMETRLAREDNLRQLIDSFDSNIGEVVSAIENAAGQMSGTATTLTNVADHTRAQTSSASASSTETSSNVQTVASAAEELSASIGEIGEQVTRATEVVSRASARVNKTNTEVVDLAQAAQRIGEVVSLIQAIAEQTNLLALNATIEAARAGEAGRGFAVVASEVKELATQTANATEEISQHISGIQGSTDSTVEAIGDIGTIMEEVNTITGSIAAAVEEQASSTQEISRNVQEAASGTEDVARNVSGIAGAVDEAAQSAADVQGASQSLNERAVALRKQVNEFLKAVAAA
ncbi:MAG: methyl-accepting chemotaxis protein [Pseudomonadota bacterium]